MARVVRRRLLRSTLAAMEASVRARRIEHQSGRPPPAAAAAAPPPAPPAPAVAAMFSSAHALDETGA
eukprot:289390-Pyramimonas_sp.AAC.1